MKAFPNSKAAKPMKARGSKLQSISKGDSNKARAQPANAARIVPRIV